MRKIDDHIVKLTTLLRGIRDYRQVQGRKEKKLMFDGNTMIIDGEKLKNELTKRNVLPKDAGKELGVSRSTVQGWINRERLPGYGLKLLEKIYNIHIEDIEMTKEDTSEYDKSYDEYLYESRNEASKSAENSVISNDILVKLDLIDEHIVELTALLRGIWA